MRIMKLAAAAALAPLAMVGVAFADETNTTSAVASPADYDDGPDFYVDLTGGSAVAVNVGPVKADGGLTVAGAFGLHFSDYFRVQAEVTRTEAEAFMGTVSGDMVTYGGTAYIDLPVGDRLTLSGGAGLEFAQGNVTFFNMGQADSDGDGWHYELAGAYDLNSNVAFVAGYRNTSLDFDGVEVDSETLFAGLRFEI